jgi:protein gp37
MADGTAIEWTDATWNVVNGCTVLSPGCANCYAMTLAASRLKNHPSRAGLARMHNGHAQWTGQVRFNEAVLLDPLKWRRPRRIFVCAHGDLFHHSVPDEWIDRVFAVMALAPQHQFQVLTKRAERMRDYLTARSGYGVAPICHAVNRIPNALGDRKGALCMPLPNVWLGVSVEDQQRAVERIPYLLTTPAAVRWLSCEPLLGPVNLRDVFPDVTAKFDALTGIAEHLLGMRRQEGKIDWVVAGGESGHRARPMHPDWVRSLRDQCTAAGVPFLFKQWGSWGLGRYEGDVEAASGETAWPDGTIGGGAADANGGLGTSLYPRRKKEAGRLLDGQLHDGFPA